MIRKSISFTEQHDEWIKAQLANGNYASESEVVRDLIREKQSEENEIEALRAEIEKGINSGISDKTLGDIWAAAEKRYKERNGISTNE